MSLQQATLVLGGKRLFESVDLQLESADRIGLVGPNGAGKTSLLRLIAGELELDGGSMSRRRDLRLGYLPQDITMVPRSSLLQLMRHSVPGRDRLEKAAAAAQTELQRVSDQTASPERDATLLTLSGRLAQLHEQLAHFEQLYGDHVALRILAGLGFASDERDRRVDELSGGWQMRALLATLLFMQPDLLLLDEPTNHLDMPSVAWLGGFLRRYNHAFVLISHDREFLNEQIDRVVSFETEGVRSYRGNYEHYRAQRSEEAQVLANRNKNLQRQREAAEQFINRFRAQATKAKAVQSRIKMLDKLGDVQTQQTRRRARFAFPPCERSADPVLQTEAIERRFGELVVLHDVNLQVRRGERVAIIGPNGAGKTTLLRVLAGELSPNAGLVRLGHNVRAGYFAQHHTDQLDAAHTVYQAVARCAEDRSPTFIRSLLGALLFSGDDVDKPVRVLSGGERARVALARLLVQPRNLLLLDEPTNHLDLQSSEQLAAALESYDGTLVFVSHNRSFVRRLASRIWDVQPQHIATYPGSFDDYLAAMDDSRTDPAPNSPGAAPAVSTRDPEAKPAGNAKERKRRAAQERQRRRAVLAPLEARVAELEQRIEELETLQSERSAQLSDPAVYDDGPRRDALLRDFQRDAAELEAMSLAWEEAATAREEALAELG